MIDILPADVLGVLAEASGDDGDGSSARALACCSRVLRASLALCRPLILFETRRLEDARMLESGGIWRLQRLTLTGCETLMQKAGMRADTWDIFSITAAASTPAALEHGGPRTIRLDCLAQCAWLSDLTIDGWPLGEDGLRQIEAGPRLARLALRRLKLSSLDALAHSTWLVALALSSCWRIADLAPLTTCARLAHLTLHRYRGTELPACPAMVSLTIAEADELSSLWGLSACPNLKRLELGVCHSVRDLSPLADCAALAEVELDRCTGVRNLAPLSACSNLCTLTLSRCPSVRDVSVLAVCVSLQSLTVTDCAGLTRGNTPSRVARALVHVRSVVPKCNALL